MLDKITNNFKIRQILKTVTYGLFIRILQSKWIFVNIWIWLNWAKFFFHLYGILPFRKSNKIVHPKNKNTISVKPFKSLLKKMVRCCQIQFHLLYVIGLIGFKDRTRRGCFNKLSFNHLSSILLWLDSSYYSEKKKFESMFFF